MQQRHKLKPDVRVSEEPPDLPPIHSTEGPVAEHLGHRPRDVSDHGRGEEPDHLRRSERWHFAVVSVVVLNVDPVLAPPHNCLLVGHHSLRTEISPNLGFPKCRLTSPSPKLTG